MAFTCTQSPLGTGVNTAVSAVDGDLDEGRVRQRRVNEPVIGVESLLMTSVPDVAKKSAVSARTRKHREHVA